MSRKKDRPGILERAIQEFRWSFIFTALAFIVLGMILILWPGLGCDILSYAVGIALTVYGLSHVLTFLFAKLRSVTFELIIGVIASAIGVFILFSPATVLDMIQTVLGLIVVIDSLLSIKRAFTLRELGQKGWSIMLILSIAAAFLGILFMVEKGIFGNMLMVFIGIVLVYQGISDLLSVIRIHVMGKQLKKDLEALDSGEILIDAEK